MAVTCSKRCCVIVLNLNGRELLRPCLESLSRQQWQGFDTVVVDNGSSDGSLEMLAREFPAVRAIALGENCGFSIANNVALRDALARGYDYMLLLNNDTIVDSPCLGELLAAIGANEKTAAVCPKIYFFAQPDRIWYAGADFSLWTARTVQRAWKEKDTGQFESPNFATENNTQNEDQNEEKISVVTGCCVLLRASALQHAGLLDEDLWAYREDVEWSIRFVRAGYNLRFAPRARVWHHDGATWVGRLGGGSQAKRQFYSTRNLVLIGGMHTRWWQMPTYALGFLIHEMAFYTALRLWRWDLRALAAIYRGAYAGLAHILRSARRQRPAHPLEDCG